MKDLFGYDSYIDYLKEKLQVGGLRSGKKSGAAKAIGVHTTYISLILKEKAHLSLEQVELMNDFLDHTPDEGEYFLLMVLRDRAGLKKLATRFQRKMDDIVRRRLRVKDRITNSESISTLDQEKFYSSYLYGAIHVLVSIPEYQNLEALSKALNISIPKLGGALDFMIRIGVIKSKGGALTPGLNYVHLDKQISLISRHHLNWRLHMIANFDSEADNVHYSGAVSLSKSDAEKLKQMILDQFKENVELIKKSKEETAYVYNFDFYKLA